MVTAPIVPIILTIIAGSSSQSSMDNYTQILEETILKFNGKQILESVKTNGSDFLRTYSEEKEATYMFMDIRGFTRVSKKIITDALLENNDHANEACETAIESINRLETVNRKTKNKDIFDTGIGIYELLLP